MAYKALSRWNEPIAAAEESILQTYFSSLKQLISIQDPNRGFNHNVNNTNPTPLPIVNKKPNTPNNVYNKIVHKPTILDESNNKKSKTKVVKSRYMDIHNNPQSFNNTS